MGSGSPLLIRARMISACWLGLSFTAARGAAFHALPRAQGFVAIRSGRILSADATALDAHRRTMLD
jgi:hypothetical protein